jgi:hypothetical protein
LVLVGPMVLLSSGFPAGVVGGEQGIPPEADDTVALGRIGADEQRRLHVVLAEWVAWHH